MPSQNKFPSSLLSEPVDKRLEYFENKIIAHPRLKESYDELLQTIYHPAGASLIFVFGPTGVGKTTLRHRVEKHLIENAWSDLEKHPGRMPVMGIEAIAQSAEKFNWKDYYKRALQAMDEPLIEAKIDYEVRGIRRNAKGKLIVKYSVAPPDLRQALEKCLNYRQLTAFIVDEAQHFNKVSGGQRLLDQMDSIKSLADLTKTVHVLIGTYELLGLTDLSAQLNRRSVEIPFPRYSANSAEDAEAFKSVILTFQSHLPLEEEPDLLRHYEYLYEGSVGCVGILKDWLSRALATALKKGQKTVMLEHLEQQAVPTRRLLRMAREIKEGEEWVMERESQRTELRTLLGMGPMPTNGKSQTKTTIKPKKRGRRVGQRNPVRDPIGVN